MRYTGSLFELARNLGPEWKRKGRRHATALLISSTAVGLPLALVGCSSSDPPESRLSRSDRYGTASPRVATSDAPIPKGGGVFKIGSPYSMAGRWYVPREEPGYDRVGRASWYGADFHGRRTANGEIYDMRALSAAHPTLPLPSYVWVTNLANNRTLLVRVNDRGPYVADRLIDLSARAAELLGTAHQGVADVRVRFAGYAPLDGNDMRERQHLASQPWANGFAYASAAAPRQPQRPAAPLPSARPPVYAERPPQPLPPAPPQALGRQQDDDAWSFANYRAGQARRSSLGGPAGQSN